MLDMDETYRKYSRYVFKYLMTLCLEEYTAEELTQETFYQAVRKAHTFNGSCNVSTWLCQIAKHLWYQELSRRNHFGQNSTDKERPSEVSPPDELTDMRETKIQIFQKIHLLSDPEREVMLLRLTGAFSFKEIGEVMGRSENWARVTFFRSKQKIMKGTGENDEM